LSVALKKKPQTLQMWMDDVKWAENGKTRESLTRAHLIILGAFILILYMYLGNKLLT